MIPINRNSKDPFYRYKMPPVLVKTDTCKSYITNLCQIARSLHRNPLHILKFLSFALGCNCAATDKFSLNGKFDQSTIQSALYDFIDFFVLCKLCSNPETKFVCEEDLSRRCFSCGEVFPQEKHRLVQIIMKDRDKVNEDLKYTQLVDDAPPVEAEVHTEVSVVAPQGTDSSLNDFFTGYIKAKDLPSCSWLKDKKIEDILFNIEIMLEANKKEDKIESYLDSLASIGFGIDGMETYFSVPRRNKKRSPLIKKNAEYYFENHS